MIHVVPGCSEISSDSECPYYAAVIPAISVKMVEERLYGEDKKKALKVYFSSFSEEIDALFLRKFEELSDLNVGEGETTRIVGRLLNAKTNLIDSIKASGRSQ